MGWWEQNWVWVSVGKNSSMMPYYYTKELTIGIGRLQITFAWKYDAHGRYIRTIPSDYFEQKNSNRMQSERAEGNNTLEFESKKVRNIVKR